MSSLSIRTELGLAIFILSLLCGSATAQGPIEVEAIAGEHYGVGRISVRFPQHALPDPLGPEGISVWEKNGRILYPVVQPPTDNTIIKKLLLGSPLLDGGPVRREVAGILQGFLNQDPRTNVYFLFRGSEPLDVTLQIRGARRMRIVPRRTVAPADHAHARLLALWWQELNAKPGGLLKGKPDYPPLVKNYLQSMLAVQLGLPLPDDGEDDWWTQIEEHIGLFLGTESVLLAAEQSRMLGLEPTDQSADLPLPKAMTYAPLEFPDIPKDVKIESISKRVPAECIYVRFGSYANFQWIQDMLAKWGGDISNLVSLRGLDRESSARMERQLAMAQSALGRILGPAVISDVAIIGTDMFMNEGAAYGILFEARNQFMLSTNFTSHHSSLLKQDKTATKKTVEIAGKKVTFITNTAGTIRSYYLADNGYILTTTSKNLMRLFIETGIKKTDKKDATKTGPSLADTPGFRHARTVMPLAREDTIFVYISDEFFRNMAGPKYWIGMARRLQAAADIQLVQLATLAAGGENMPADTTEELVRGRFLPAGFQNRPAGNKTVIDGDTVHDSLFGRLGSFVPIPDVPIEKVTPHEAAAYERFQNFYRQEWGRLDPMIIGIKRHDLPDNQIRIVIDAQANPFSRRHYDMLSSRLGPADKNQLAPIPGDIMFMETQLTDQRLFGGVQDVGMPFDINGGQFMPLDGLFNIIVGYFGTNGQMGLLSILDQLLAAQMGPGGFNLGENGLHRIQSEQFTIFSFQPDVLAAVNSQLHFEEAPRPAQIRMRIKDVARARITPTLNALGYLRTRTTTLGNIHLMHQLAQQFNVPGPECKKAAERLLGAKLICPLRGTYHYVEDSNGLGHWTSTALEAKPAPQAANKLLGANIPADHLSPPLDWFRGMEMDAAMTPKSLSAHVDLVMLMPEEEPLEVIPRPEPTIPADAKKTDSKKSDEKKPAKKRGGLLDMLLPSKK